MFRKWAVVVLAALLGAIPVLAAQDADPVLFAFEDTAVCQSEVVQYASNLNYFGYLDSATDYEGAIQYMIVNQLAPRQKAAEAGLDQLTPEERAQAEAEAHESFESYIDYYIEQNTQEGTQAEREALRERAIQYWASYGCTLDYYIDSYIDKTVFARLYETLDLEPTEAQVEALFEQNCAKDRAYFEGNIKDYEYYRHLLGYDIWYVPEGYRGITQILLTPDAELLEKYKAAKRAPEYSQADVDAAREAIIEACEAQIEEIYGRLEAGEDFEELIAQYGQDPDMTGAALQEGYAVHPQSVVWEDEFTEAAFGPDMQKPGDVSRIAVSAYGVHILMYKRDIPTEVVLTDEIRESIVSYLRSERLNQLLNAWAAEYEVTYNREALDALKAQED